MRWQFVLAPAETCTGRVIAEYKQRTESPQKKRESYLRLKKQWEIWQKIWNYVLL